MRRLFWILAWIGCSTPQHPDFLGDCAKQPCGTYIPGQGGSTSTPTDAGFDVVDTGAVPVDSGTMTDAPATDGTAEDTGATDAGDERDP